MDTMPIQVQEDRKYTCYTEGVSILTWATDSVRPPGMPFTCLERAIEPQLSHNSEWLNSLAGGLTDLGRDDTAKLASMMVSLPGGW